MGRAQFEYDQSGGTSYYFITTFVLFTLIPATYYFWPRKKRESKKSEEDCHCDGCIIKTKNLNKLSPQSNLKNTLIKFLIILVWILFLYIAYTSAKIERNYAEYDPYAILELDKGASTSEIKKKYRQLSAKFHPDVKETGDHDKFMKIAKAYAAWAICTSSVWKKERKYLFNVLLVFLYATVLQIAQLNLTDEASRKNWEEFGNPDGPTATTFGIALPAWIVEKGNSIWVLSAYVLVFMIILPVIVGTWWYKSIKYSGDKVLIDTTQMYMYFFHKTPNMMLKRVLMILAASFEFCKFYNTEIHERPSDNLELPQHRSITICGLFGHVFSPVCLHCSGNQLMYDYLVFLVKSFNVFSGTFDFSCHQLLLKRLTNLNEKNKERPLSAPYSVKARILLHAHLTRLDLPPNTLELDKQYILKKCPPLLNEMVNCVAQLMALASSGRIQHSPRLETMENVIKTSQMIIQGLWEFKSPLLQLPHITEDTLKHCINKRYSIRTIKDMVTMKENDRKHLLSKLSDKEYKDICFVLSRMPHVDIDITFKVIDDEDTQTITANSIVTATVTLTRKSMSVFMNDTSHTANGIDEQQQTITHLSGSVQQKEKMENRLSNGFVGKDKPNSVIENEAENDDEALDSDTQKPTKQPVYKPKKKNFPNKKNKKKNPNIKNKQSTQVKEKLAISNKENPKEDEKPIENIKEKKETTNKNESESESMSQTSPSSTDSEEYSSQDEDDKDLETKQELEEAMAMAAFEAADDSCGSCDGGIPYGANAPLMFGKIVPKGKKTADHNTPSESTEIDHKTKTQSHKESNIKTKASEKASKIGKKTRDKEPGVGKKNGITKDPDKSDAESNHEKENRNKKHSSEAGNDNNNEMDDDDDELWDEEFQRDLRKQEKVLFEGNKPLDIFEVHAPYFPEKKFERWWLYMADRKHSSLITAPVYITSLNESEEFQLKFPAPPKSGLYVFSVVVKSDSYLDCDFSRTIKLDVKEEKVMDKHHPQWDISESDNEGGGDAFADFFKTGGSKTKKKRSSGSSSDSESDSENRVNSSSNPKKKHHLSDMEYTTEEESEDPTENKKTN